MAVKELPLGPLCEEVPTAKLEIGEEVEKNSLCRELSAAANILSWLVYVIPLFFSSLYAAGGGALLTPSN
jgi:hypothetical protein